MSQAIDTRQRPGPAGEGPRGPRKGERFHGLPVQVWLFRQLTSMRFALVLLFIFALLTLAGTLLQLRLRNEPL